MYSGTLSLRVPLPGVLRDPCGSFEIYGAAYVDLPQLMEAMRAELQTKQCYQDGHFDHHSLQQDSSKLWRYGDLAAKRIIFCEGAAVRHNPFFPHLPIQPVKGETLAFRSPKLQVPRSIFTMGNGCSHGENRFRIGATYDEQDLTELPTPAAKSTSSFEALAQILKEVPELEIEQQLTLRPSTIDARPIIGPHPF